MQRVVKQVDMDGGKKRSRQYEYNNNCNPVAITDYGNQTTNYAYDCLGQVVEKTDPAGGTTKFAYNDLGRVIRVTKPDNSTVRYEYNAAGRLTRIIRPMGETVIFTYDANGNLKSRTNPSGRRVQYDYDSRNLPVELRYYGPGKGSASRTVRLGYDAAGNLVSYEDGTTSAKYSYNALGRKTGATVEYGSFSLSYSYTYTKDGRKKSLTYPDGTTVEYGYAQGRLSTVHIPGQGDITRSDFTWNRAENSMYPGGSTIKRDLGPFMRHKRITAIDPAGNSVFKRKYTYSSADNLLSRNRLSGNSTFGYDKLDRLVSAKHSNLSDAEYSYDVVGNRLTSADINGTWSYNANNELIGYNGISYEYDDSGKVVAKKMNNQTVRRYRYNTRGRLARVLDGSGNEIASYYYDPFGRRLWKEVNGEKTYFLYSEQGLIGEYAEDGTAVRTYGYRPASKWTADPLFQKTEGAYYWYINDRQGTPKKLISQNGRVVWSAKYKAFGKAHITRQEVRNPLRRAGQYHDNETGISYNWHRYYSPALGRYLQNDPLREGLNLYLYAKNNPYRYVDPRGLCVIKDTYTTTVEFWSIQLTKPRTLQIGLGFTAGSIKGTSKSGGIVIGYNPEYEDVFQFGTYASGGAGLYGGASASINLNVSVSSNERIEDLEGWSGTAGGSGKIPGVPISLGLERSTPVTTADAEPVYSMSAGIGIGMRLGGYGYAKYTKIW
jgi:RHS repeat-associated protein